MRIVWMSASWCQMFCTTEILLPLYMTFDEDIVLDPLHSQWKEMDRVRVI